MKTASYTYLKIEILKSKQNQMHEALTLFDSLINCEWFKKKSIILSLNKTDVFRKKIAISPVSKHFPGYIGPDTDYGAAAEYFASRFREVD